MVLPVLDNTGISGGSTSILSDKSQLAYRLSELEKHVNFKMSVHQS